MVDQVQRVADGLFSLIAIVLGHQLQPPPVHAAGAVDAVEIGLDDSAHLHAVGACRAGEGRRHAQHDGLVPHTRIDRPGLRTKRQHQARQQHANSPSTLKQCPATRSPCSCVGKNGICLHF